MLGTWLTSLTLSTSNLGCSVVATNLTVCRLLRVCAFSYFIFTGTLSSWRIVVYEDKPWGLVPVYYNSPHKCPPLGCWTRDLSTKTEYNSSCCGGSSVCCLTAIKTSGPLKARSWPDLRTLDAWTFVHDKDVRAFLMRAAGEAVRRDEHDNRDGVLESQLDW
jgi:hypothetical protein